MPPQFTKPVSEFMLNRSIPPPIRQVSALRLPHAEVLQLRNGIPLYRMHYPDQEIFKIEVMFFAGRLEESQRASAKVTSRMLREGAGLLDTAAIAEHFDYYGASVGTPASLDNSSVVLYGLRKHLPEVLPLFAQIILEPTFPQQELDTYIRAVVHDAQVELDKIEVQAYRKITELIFGAEHPYGYNSMPADYQALDRNALDAYYQRWFTPANACIIASGCIDEDAMRQIDNLLGQFSRSGPTKPAYPEPILAPPLRFDQQHDGSLQTAIRLGRRLFNRHHPDYTAFFVVNTILGGYFGSRLMTNIREKKGYTYNIYSSVDTLRHDGYFYIATEVNNDKAAATLRQINSEIRKLRETLVSEQELEMVRNYILGMLLNGLDGPMNSSDMLKSFVMDQLPFEVFGQMLDVVLNITPQKIQETAQQYLQSEDLWTVCVGDLPAKGRKHKPA